MSDSRQFVQFVVWEEIYIPKINEDDHLRLALWLKEFGGWK